MFWNDIKEIREWMITIATRLTDLQMKYDSPLDEQNDEDDPFDNIHPIDGMET